MYKYKRLDDIFKKKKLKTGGKTLGQGTFGRVFSLPDELFQCNNNNILLIYITKDLQIQKESVSCATFFNKYYNIIACKEFSNSKDLADEFNGMYYMIKYCPDHIQNTTILGEQERYLVEFQYENKQYIVSKLMHGDLTKLDWTIDTITQMYAVIQPIISQLNSQNYYHNDIKPENILYTKESNKITYYVSDFGLVSNKVNGGTPLFMMSYRLPERKKEVEQAWYEFCGLNISKWTKSDEHLCDFYALNLTCVELVGCVCGLSYSNTINKAEPNTCTLHPKKINRHKALLETIKPRLLTNTEINNIASRAYKPRIRGGPLLTNND